MCLHLNLVLTRLLSRAVRLRCSQVPALQSSLHVHRRVCLRPLPPLNQVWSPVESLRHPRHRFRALNRLWSHRGRPRVVQLCIRRRCRQWVLLKVQVLGHRWVHHRSRVICPAMGRRLFTRMVQVYFHLLRQHCSHRTYQARCHPIVPAILQAHNQVACPRRSLQ